MTGLKSCLATLALLAGIGASAPARGMVQGGWTSHAHSGYFVQFVRISHLRFQISNLRFQISNQQTGAQNSWDPYQFGDQAFGGPAFVGGTFGYGMPGVGLRVNPHGVGGVVPFGVGTSPHGLGSAAFGPNAGRAIDLDPLDGGMARVPQTAGGVAPLIVVIRQSTRPSLRR